LPDQRAGWLARGNHNGHTARMAKSGPSKNAEKRTGGHFNERSALAVPRCVKLLLGHLHPFFLPGAVPSSAQLAINTAPRSISSTPAFPSAASGAASASGDMVAKATYLTDNSCLSRNSFTNINALAGATLGPFTVNATSQFGRCDAVLSRSRIAAPTISFHSGCCLICPIII
jgi:hypothetical protein